MVVLLVLLAWLGASAVLLALAAGDARAADLAGRARDWLREQSERIGDEALRARYLTTPVAVELARVAAAEA